MISITSNRYIRLMRFDHWIKQLFILPGAACAIFFNSTDVLSLSVDVLLALLATSLIASANYVINEFLDAKTDSFHPTKKYRTAVMSTLNAGKVWLLWGLLSIVGFLIGLCVNVPFVLTLATLWIMGIVYNVKPLRSKDVTYLDVLTESINNAIRLMLGWFVVTQTFLPPCSIIIGYWMAGAFLMATKRLAEYRMIDNAEQASLYRKSFAGYNEKTLLCSVVFYAMTSVFFIGVFLIKYRIELIAFIPFLILLYCYYLFLVYREDSCVQKPEKLYHERGLMIFCTFLLILFCMLLFIDIPQLEVFTSNILITI
ncbi:MAG: UbiA family prenyltransferase [Prevotella sp.]